MLNPFRKKEKFLLLDVSPEKISGLLISVDGKKRIRKEKFWNDLEKRVSSKRPPLVIAASRAIVACEPSLAFKVFVPLSIKRENRAEPIDKVELENLLAQTIGRIFNQHRREAGLVLGSDELDTILADSKVSGFEVDGHKVINPLGFAAGEISATLEMTFTSRATFYRAKLIRKKADFFFTEKSYAKAAVMKRVDSKPADLLSIGEERSYFYPGGKDAKSPSRHELKWSLGALSGEMGRQWALSREARAGVYGYYMKEGVSPSVDKHLKKTFSGSLNNLSKQVKKLKTSSKVCVTGDVPLALLGRSQFCEVPLADLMEKSGFTFDEEDFVSGNEALERLAPFLEFYYDNSDTEINGWLKRRLHWLGSAV